MSECGRCGIDCTKYATGYVPTRDEFTSSNINIKEIERAFNEKIEKP
ncbi:MAG: hypothetical protein MPF33_10910 [Candidatus Aramenus sp.]|jgi:hypothetical protein|nr:hypothetical protein [Candidatus Aramenus sp.]